VTANYSLARYSTARYSVKEAHEATWARRIALFFLQLLILTVLLHRFLGLGTPAAINLIGVSMVGLLLAILVAVASLVRIWFGGQKGAGQAFAAIFIALLGLAAPAYFLAQGARLPMLNDVETTPGEVMDFKVLNGARPADANPLKQPDAAAVEAQKQGYPDLAPMALERSATEVFAIVNEAVERLGWEVALSEPPGGTGEGRIEATDRTLVMGFTDDVLVRVKGSDAHAVIDVRSVSRYGAHDLGANADRIRALFAEVTAGLEKGEKTVLEQVAPKEEETDKAPVKKPAKKKGARRQR
jgi:uncharacterized protein (DUF1499 family)